MLFFGVTLQFGLEASFDQEQMVLHLIQIDRGLDHLLELLKVSDEYLS